MAGRGPVPKDAARRARRNQTGTLRVVPASAAEQPPLPDGMDWPDQTRSWWAQWAQSPLAEEFTEVDWSFLLDTALLHARLWQGGVNVAGELRLRVAKMGATPEDRARLRIQFAVAEERTTRPASSARDRYSPRSLAPVDAHAQATRRRPSGATR